MSTIVSPGRRVQQHPDLAELIAARGTAIMAHRGSTGVAVIENTARAAIVAMLSGADIVEVDVTGSTDGAYFAFHDGEEKRLLGRDVNLLGLTADEIHQIPFVTINPETAPVRIESIEHVLTTLWQRFPHAQVNLDRSWTHWPAFLPFLDRFPHPHRLLLKSPATSNHWKHLQEHPVKYPYVGICHTIAEAEAVLSLTDVNVVGVELIALTSASPFFDRAVLDSFRSRGAILIANAEVLAGGTDLFAGHNDDESLFETGPGWTRLLELGFDVIQTDWPWLLRQTTDAHHNIAHNVLGSLGQQT